MAPIAFYQGREVRIIQDSDKIAFIPRGTTPVRVTDERAKVIEEEIKQREIGEYQINK